MTTLIAGRCDTVFLSVGQTLVLAVSNGTGSIVRLPIVNGQGEPFPPVPFFGVAMTLGPYDDIARFQICCSTGSIDFRLMVTVPSPVAAAQKLVTGALSSGLQIVAGRGNFPLGNFTPTANVPARMRFVAAKAGTDLRLAFFTGYGTNGNPAENLSTTQITFSAGVEFPRGVVTQATFAGQTKPTFPPGQWVVSDPVAITWADAAEMWVRTTAFVGGTFPVVSFAIFNAGNSQQDGDGLGYRVVSATNASPIVITGSGNHNLTSGDSVTITGALGNTAANGTWTITKTAANAFSLNGSTGNGTFTGGAILTGPDLSQNASGQMGGATSATGYFMPVALLGRPLAGPSAPWVAILLDSIARGSGDSVGLNEGWIARGLGGGLTPTIPFVNVSIPGLTSAQFADAQNLSTQSEKRRRLMLAAPYIINNGGTNDLAAGATWQQVAGYNLSIASDAASRGSRVVQATIIPKTTSTDLWATAGNQTPSAQESVRVAYNQWLRAGAPIVAGAAVTAGTSGALLAGAPGHPFWKVIDPASLVEVDATNALTVDGGRWLTTGAANAPTADGTHPTTAYHIILSAAVSAIVSQML